MTRIPESSGAFALSKQRRELYDNGTYVPTFYAMILAKSDVLAHTQSGHRAPLTISS